MAEEEAKLDSYNPTPRENLRYKLADWLSSTLDDDRPGFLGIDPYKANRFAGRVTGVENASDGSGGIGLADFSPVSPFLAGPEIKRDFQTARSTDDKLGMGMAVGEGVLETAAAIPVAGVALKGAAKGIKTLADTLTDSYDPSMVGGNLGNVFSTSAKAAEEVDAPSSIQDSPETPESLDQLAEDVSITGVRAASPYKNTVKAYKLFQVKPSKPDEFFPLFVNTDKSTPMGQWVDAEIGPAAKGGRVQSLIGDLSFRPGWHSGDYISATHIGGKTDRTLSGPDYRKANQVWVEVEVPADVDWQAEATSRARTKADGELDLSTAEIKDQIPEGGFYRYKTNPNMQGNWLISGSMKINRVLEADEVKAIQEDTGILDLPTLPEVIDQKSLKVEDLTKSAQAELKRYYPEKYNAMMGNDVDVQMQQLGAETTDTVPATVAEQTENMLNTNRRVDTRLPTSKTSSDFAQMGEGELVSDGDAMFSANTNMADNFAMMAEYYPGMKNLWSDDVAETRANVTERMTDNIVSLYDMSDRLGIAGESKQWYKGANRIALGLSSRFGVQDTKAAGVLAALSPQKNWFENVALAERLIKHHTELGPNAPWSQAMDDITTTVPPARKKQGNTSFQDGKNNTVLESIKGKTWGELETPEQKGMWLRAYDEAHFGRQFREVSPEGDILGYVTTNDGTPALASHQGFTTLAKVVRILEGDGTLNSISPELGKEHKVRNFFNNILNPDSPKDVTVDTHQIAAGLFRPLGAGSVEVKQGLSGGNVTGNPAIFSNEGKANSGMGGTYGLYFDATAEGAKLRGVLPREMQSVSWEQLRTLFPDTLKRDQSFIAATEAIWRMVDDKQLDPEGARNLIIAEAEKRGQTEDKLIPSWQGYKGKRRDIGIATAGLMGAAGLATAEESPAEEEGFAIPE